jgi:hypothetical protein
MKGYCITRVYLVSCSKCNEDITRTLSGDEPTTRAEAEETARIHEQEWHPATPAGSPL